jgi:geranylgeranyl pyrophosphate synthase
MQGGVWLLDIKQLLLEKKPLIDKTIEKWLPRKFDEKTLEQICGKPRYKFDVETLQRTIADPFWDFLDRGGKRWRPYLFLLVAEALGAKPEKYLDLVLIPEVVHNGSIVVDDIEDDSEMRRGKPCLHKIFGIDVAINVGNFMYFFPLLPLYKNREKFDEKTFSKILEVYIQEMINIHIGQATDIGWHKGFAKEITEEQYLQMCAFKTGTLARMSAKIAAIVAGADDATVEKIGRFAESIGIAFQIQDDILNVSESELAKGKGGIGEDITEGKRTLMVIYTLKKASEEDKKRLLEILDMHTRDPQLIQEAIDILRKYDAINYAKEFARRLVRETWSGVDKILPESEAKRKLKAFADFLIERDV